MRTTRPGPGKGSLASISSPEQPGMLGLPWGLAAAGVGSRRSHPRASCLAAPPPQRTDRPVSSQGRLSQRLSPREGSEMRVDMPPGEGLEEPTRGPRSSTAH